MFSEEELKILIIEDDLSDFELIKGLLFQELKKVSVHSAKSFLEAKEILTSSQQFDTILLDLEFPEVSSKQLAADVLELAGNVPVIVLTNDLTMESGLEAVSMGVSDYLPKNELSALQLIKSVFHSIERKHIAIKLQESENKYKNLLRYSPVPMWVFDAETLKFLFVNEAAVKSYGYSRDEFLSMSIKDIKPHEEKKLIDYYLKSSNFNPQFFEGMTTHLKKNGEYIKVNIQGSYTTFDGREARLIFATDVTEKVKAEAALKLREQRFKALVQNSLELLGIVDRRGKYIYISPSVESILGWKAENLIGINAFDFVHKDDLKMTIEKFDLLDKQKIVQISPVRYKNAEGGFRWMETIVTDRRSDPSIHGIVFNSRDITERVEHIKAIEEQNKKLREIGWMQSHMIRSPLSRIMGLVELLREENIQGIETEEILDYVFSSANELDNIIRAVVKKTEEIENEIDHEFKDNNH